MCNRFNKQKLKLMTKTCTRCKKDKNLEDFHYHQVKNIHRSNCKECVREYSKKYQKEYREVKRRVIADNKDCCLKCNESRKHILHFHHLDPSTKEFTISNINNINVTQMKKEIEKCVVLCSNCHLDFHFLEKTQNIKITEYLL